MIKRDITSYLESLAKQYHVIAVMGPRQSGKTTLTQQVFPTYAYVSLENLDNRRMALEDPRGFLATYAQYPGMIIDEIQEAPQLLSYMQGIVDQSYRPGYFVITGSQHFLMYEKITQTLAGRIALLTLLPLSVHELKEANIVQDSFADAILKGGYPRIYAQNVPVGRWCADYIATYVERDVRQILNVTDIMAFQGFLKLCAARVGNIVSYADLARDAGISLNTAKAWISILQTSFIITLVPPYYKNFNKRVIKSPKLYFYDTSLLCALLGVKTTEEVFTHPLKGALFESFVISEMLKYSYNRAEFPSMYFWRDVQGHEIDVIVEKSFEDTIPIEIKASMTYAENFFQGLHDWQDISGQKDVKKYVVYAGDQTILSKHGMVSSWRDMMSMLHVIYQGGGET